MTYDLTWAPHIPLIGGFPLGAEMALGKPPVEIYSLPGFGGNDLHYVNYQQKTLGRNIAYTPIEPDDHSFRQKVNIIVATPPCAALSQLNTGKKPEAKGAGCAKNDFMYMVVDHGVKCFDADVIIIENAPALFTSKGEAVAKRLEELAYSHGRSISFYKTSTVYHGIPQARDRTFAFIWKLEHAPILKWYKRPYEKFADYLNQVPVNSIQQDIVVNPKVADECFYQFMKHKLGKNDCREDIRAIGKKTAFQWVDKTGSLDEAIAWFYHTGNERGIKVAEHAKNKQEMGMGIWDGSVHIASEYTQAWIGRNMNDTIHPSEDRSLTIRESLHMMGFPHDFELLGGRKNVNMIAQNVPTCTARDMVVEAAEAIVGNRESSWLKLFKQNNHNETFVTPIEEIVSTLESLFEVV